MKKMFLGYIIGLLALLFVIGAYAHSQESSENDYFDSMDDMHEYMSAYWDTDIQEIMDEHHEACHTSYSSDLEENPPRRGMM